MSSEKKRTSLITGGCGLIGRHLTYKLLKRGDEVWIVDDLSVGRHPDQWLSGFTKSAGGTGSLYSNEGSRVHFLQANVIDLYRDILSLPVRVDDVFHLAAIVKGRGYIEKDPLGVGTNLALDSLFFNWLSRNKDKFERALYPSSAVVYPDNIPGAEGRTVALREDMVNFRDRLGLPDSLSYGWAKLTGEYLARFAAEKYGIHVACVRPFAGYAEDQDLDYAIPAIARRIARREDPIEVWGSGDQGRDFIHADDWAGGALAALDHISDGRPVNVGMGKATTFKEIISILAELAGYQPAIKPLLDKPTGFQTRYADISLLTSFGWQPEVSLREGLQRVLAAAEKEVRGNG